MNLAAAARQALAADAVVVLDLSDASVVFAADGLSAAEVGEVVHDARVAPPSFATVMYEEGQVADTGAAAICALQRHPRRFENTGLAAAFARHAATASAARRQASQNGRPVVSDIDLSALGEGTGYEELNEAIADEIGAFTGARTSGVLVWDDEAQDLRPLPGAFGSNSDTVPPAHLPHDWASSAVRVFSTGEPYLTNRALGDCGVLQDYVEAFGLERLMTVPMDVGQRRIGVLQVANKPTDFTIGDLHVVAALVRRIAVGVEVTRMRHGFLRRARFEEILGGMAVEIASGRNLQDFLGPALDALCAAVHASLITLVPVNGEPMVWRRDPPGEHLERILIAEAREARSMRVYGIAPRRAGEPGWSALHVPLVLSDKQVATLSALRRGGESFDQDDCRALSRLANLIALAWATERYQRHLADSARVAERQRIADELHDQVAQLLFAARISLDSVLDLPDLPEAAAANVARGRDLIGRADVATRQVMHQLAQVTDDGLPDRLEALVGSVEEEFGRPVQLEITPAATDAAGRLGRPARNLLARAAREALVNAAKHAGPCQLAVRITVSRRNRLLLTVTDDGLGVTDRGADGYGTGALRRAVRMHGGFMRVKAASTGGTKVTVSLPL